MTFITTFRSWSQLDWPHDHRIAGDSYQCFYLNRFQRYLFAGMHQHLRKIAQGNTYRLSILVTKIEQRNVVSQGAPEGKWRIGHCVQEKVKIHCGSRRKKFGVTVWGLVPGIDPLIYRPTSGTETTKLDIVDMKLPHVLRRGFLQNATGRTPFLGKDLDTWI